MTSEYSIDTLRNADGTFSFATPRLIKGALNCGHTAHLQNNRGTVAIRPYTVKEVRTRTDGSQYFPGEQVGQNWLVDFYPAGHNHGDEITWRGPEEKILDAIAFIFKHLNGKTHDFETGDSVRHYANQAKRDATVLAVLGDEVLIEYEMPGTTSGRETSALVLCSASVMSLSQIRTYPHRKLPMRWVQAMNDQDAASYWIGAGQGEREPVEFPSI